MLPPSFNQFQDAAKISGMSTNLPPHFAVHQFWNPRASGNLGGQGFGIRFHTVVVCFRTSPNNAVNHKGNGTLKMTIHLYICIVWSTQKWVWFNWLLKSHCKSYTLGENNKISPKRGKNIEFSKPRHDEVPLQRCSVRSTCIWGHCIPCYKHILLSYTEHHYLHPSSEFSNPTLKLVIVPDISSFWSTHEFIPRDQNNLQMMGLP